MQRQSLNYTICSAAKIKFLQKRYFMITLNIIYVFIALCISIGFASNSAAQQRFPTKPIRFILPNAPGGSNDVVARLIGEKLSASWGQPIIVDSRPGGNNIIAADALLKSTADGHTILLVTAAHVINPLLLPKHPYDAIKDFSPIATLVSTDYILVLNAALPANTLSEFIALAKAKPGQLNGAGSNTGGIQHLALELFNMLANVKLQHVPYKGGGPGMTDLIGGQIQFAFNNAITVTPHIKSGKIKAIAVGGEARLPILPLIPTFVESGMTGFNVKNWFGVVAPARTPNEIINKIANEIIKIQGMTDVKEKLAMQGVQPFINGSNAFTQFLKLEIEKYGRIVKAANIKIEY
jgi:hypothetical protein